MPSPSLRFMLMFAVSLASLLAPAASMQAPQGGSPATSGSSLFAHVWTRAEGLGAPEFNAESCATCHVSPAIGGAGGNRFNVLQLRGSAGYSSDDSLAVMTQAHLSDLRRDSAQADAFIHEVQTPSLFGIGQLETISADEILRREDPDDRDGDGIRGVARRVALHGGEEIGRFGWKAQAPELADFVCMALSEELGATAPDQGRGFGRVRDRDEARDPEISQKGFDELLRFVRQLASPARAGSDGDPEVRRGEELFRDVGCTGCHVPALPGTDGPVRLYSDLLLHEVLLEPAAMERAVSCGVQVAERSSGPLVLGPHVGFRTPPLWGVRDTAPYLHDGRAATLREAILAHGGEAQRARDGFAELEDAAQAALIAFLRDL